jgi:hypothetical protein
MSRWEALNADAAMARDDTSTPINNAEAENPGSPEAERRLADVKLTIPNLELLISRCYSTTVYTGEGLDTAMAGDDSNAPTNNPEAVKPGSPGAERRLADLELTAPNLELLVALPVRIALLLDCSARSRTSPSSLTPRPAAGEASHADVSMAGDDANVPSNNPEAVNPGSPEAERRLADVKLTVPNLELLVALPVRIALLLDYSVRSRTPHTAGGRAITDEKTIRQFNLWSRSLHVLRTLLRVLPNTPLRVGRPVSKAFKDASSSEMPNLKVHATASKLLHIAVFAYAAPGFLEGVLGPLIEHTSYVLQAGDPLTIEDLCMLIRLLQSPESASKLDATAADYAQRFLAEVLRHTEAMLRTVLKDDPGPHSITEVSNSTRTTRFRLGLISAIRVLEVMLVAPNGLSKVQGLVALLPRIFELGSAMLKDLSEQVRLPHFAGSV